MIDREPDYRFTLANERTFLAWIRTALGLLAGGVVVGQLYMNGMDNRVHQLLAAMCTLLASAISVGAFTQWRRVQTAMRRDEPLPRSPMMPILVGGVCAAAAMSVGLVVL